MATVTGLTAERMLAIEGASVIDGDVVDGTLILTQHDGTEINAGSVIGPVGPVGPMGPEGSVPTGSMMMWPTATPPSGWLLCDGLAVPAGTQYDALRALIGVNTPNLKQRIPIGRDTAKAEFDTLGETGGSTTHVHTGPSHTHTGPSHRHAAGSLVTQEAFKYTNTRAVGGYDTNSADHTHDITGYTDYQGTGNTGAAGTGDTSGPEVAGGGPVIPFPYFTVNFIIKI